jgi:hypothetical protein
MTDSIPTPAQIDRQHREDAAAAATIQLEQLKQAYRDSPDQRAARARARLEDLAGDPHFQNRALTSQAARNEQQAAEYQLRVANRDGEAVEAARDPWDRVETAFKDEPLPLVDTTRGDELPMSALRAEVLDGRAKGWDTPIIEEAFLPNRNSPEIIAEARRILEAHLGDPEWTAKLMAGDREISAEWAKLSRVARATENEPPWSPRLR